MMNILLIASLTLRFLVTNHARVSILKGEAEHALFHALIHLCDPALFTRLHDEPSYRPFTISSMKYVYGQGNSFEFHPGQHCFLRITCFDVGYLWTTLLTRFQTGEPLLVRLGALELRLEDLFSTPQTDPIGLACCTDWSTLASLPHSPCITLHFSSPTAFSIGRRRFALFTEPLLIWESLLRVWNSYAPVSMHMDRQQIRTAILTSVHVLDCNLWTETLRFSTFVQKGFLGWCRYELVLQPELGSFLTTLAAFAQFAGVGYKTTMGMGQVRVVLSDTRRKEVQVDM